MKIFWNKVMPYFLRSAANANPCNSPAVMLDEPLFMAASL